MLHDDDKPNNGIRQLREIKTHVTREWEELGLLDGLSGLSIDKNIAELFECCPSQIIIDEPENDIDK